MSCSSCFQGSFCCVLYPDDVEIGKQLSTFMFIYVWLKWLFNLFIAYQSVFADSMFINDDAESPTLPGILTSATGCRVETQVIAAPHDDLHLSPQSGSSRHSLSSSSSSEDFDVVWFASPNRLHWISNSCLTVARNAVVNLDLIPDSEFKVRTPGLGPHGGTAVRRRCHQLMPAWSLALSLGSRLEKEWIYTLGSWSHNEEKSRLQLGSVETDYATWTMSGRRRVCPLCWGGVGILLRNCR